MVYIVGSLSPITLIHESFALITRPRLLANQHELIYFSFKGNWLGNIIDYFLSNGYLNAICKELLFISCLKTKFKIKIKININVIIVLNDASKVNIAVDVSAIKLNFLYLRSRLVFVRFHQYRYNTIHVSGQLFRTIALHILK